jgi:NitT/TauT family transport system permease protein/sulfonate transport system permease protein
MVDTAIALAQSSRSRGLFARRLAAHLFMLLFLAAWQAAALVAPSYLLPSPVQVAWRLWSFVTSWRDLGHLGASLYHVAAAIAISFVIGSLLALIPYYVPLLGFAAHRDLCDQRRAGAIRIGQHVGRPRQSRCRDPRNG